MPFVVLLTATVSLAADPHRLAPTCADPLADLAPIGSACGTSALVERWQQAQRAGQGACFDRALTRARLGPPRSDPERRRSAPPDGLSPRDPYGVARAHESEHFVVRWGSAYEPDPARLAWFVDLFEASYETEIVRMGYPYPNGGYKFNVYIGGTGPDGIPDLIGLPNYTWWDEAGWPMVVIDAYWFENDGYVSMFPPHELFHAVQMGIGSYQAFGGPTLASAWYWEATAHWTVEEALPGEPYHPVFLQPLAYHPELPIDYYGIEADDPAQNRHYGAFLFVRHLTDAVADADLVKRSWLEADPQDDPLDVVAELLAEQGADLADAYFAFAARNATWDYPARDAYLVWIAAESGWDASGFPSGTLAPGSGWVRPTERLPRSLGANYWQLDAIPPSMTVEVEGDAGPGRWYAAFVQRDGESHTRMPLVFEGDRGTLTLHGVQPADEQWIVVAAGDGPPGDGVGFGYQLRVTAADDGPTPDTDSVAPPDDEAPLDDAPKDDEPASSGCGCAATGRGSAAGFALLVAALGRRQLRWRRRR